MNEHQNGETTAEHARRGTIAAEGRRSDDITLKRIWQDIRRSRWVFSFAVVVCTWGGVIGGQVLGPVSRRVSIVADSLRMIDSMHTLQFRVLQQVDSRVTLEIDDLAGQTKLNSYLICTFTRRNDPAAVPPECNQVILDWRRGIR
jgi:hypothetical protein